MSWEPLPEPTREEVSAFQRQVKKARFLVDENLGFGTTELLRAAKWNVKDASELGLTNRSDDDVFSTAYRENRIILTHDSDFLDDRRFPPDTNPGIVVLPGASGSEEVLVRALAQMLSIVGNQREMWRGAKLVFSEDNKLRISKRDETGAMRTTLYQVPKHGPVLIWVEDNDLDRT